MKTANRTLLTLLAIAFTCSMQSQYMGASVGYMKVKPGQWSNYLELEKQGKEFHQARVENGIITQWHLYQKVGETRTQVSSEYWKLVEFTVPKQE